MVGEFLTTSAHTSQLRFLTLILFGLLLFTSPTWAQSTSSKRKSKSSTATAPRKKSSARAGNPAGAATQKGPKAGAEKIPSPNTPNDSSSDSLAGSTSTSPTTAGTSTGNTSGNDAGNPAGAGSSPNAGDNTGLEEIYDRFESESSSDAGLSGAGTSGSGERGRGGTQGTQGTASGGSTDKADQLGRDQKEQAAEKKIDSVAELGNLAEFKDIAVIQKKYLPRTERFELSGNIGVSTNNQFFNNIGVGARLAYAFTEKYAVEGTYLFLTSSERDITTGLKDRNIQTQSFVEPESYTGVSFKWTPVYGKVAWFEKKIIPFDLYFTPGIGVTSTATGGSETTFSLGAGQLFALSKSTAIRWDFVWNFYQAQVRVDGRDQSQNQNDLFLMIGYSFFFPEAKYR
jgi:outer membrane beta-barrel protein